MTLTHEHVKQLTALFPASAHEFLQGMTYLTEHAITARIEMVDPAWTLNIYDVRQRDKTITVIVRLTICGVCRDGVGMAVIQYDKAGLREVNEAEKSAATDALKRAARLFGIGRYLLDLPDSVKDVRSLDAYLKTSYNAPQNGENQPRDRQSPPSTQNAPSPVSGANSTHPMDFVITSRIKVVKTAKKNWYLTDDNTPPVWFPARDMFKELGVDCASWTEPDRLYNTPRPIKVFYRETETDKGIRFVATEIEYDEIPF